MYIIYIICIYMCMYGRYLQFSFPKWPLITMHYGSFFQIIGLKQLYQLRIELQKRTWVQTQPFYEIVHGKI
jgi:hypothetical protein